MSDKQIIKIKYGICTEVNAIIQFDPSHKEEGRKRLLQVVFLSSHVHQETHTTQQTNKCENFPYKKAYDIKKEESICHLGVILWKKSWLK